MNSRIIIM